MPSNFRAIVAVVLLFFPPLFRDEVLFAIAADVDAFVRCPDADFAPVSDPLEDTLFRWCVEDRRCAEAHGQVPQRNRTLFRFLVRAAVYAQRGTEPIDAIVCGNRTREEVNRALWLLMLPGRDRVAALCDVNHVQVVDERNLRVYCVCRPDRMCSDSANDSVLFYVFVGLSILILVLVSVATLAQARAELRTYGRARGAEASYEALLRIVHSGR